MFNINNKYSNFLTILLVTSIIIIFGFLAFLGIKAWQKYKTNQDAIKAISQFDEMVNETNNTVETNTNTIQLDNTLIPTNTIATANRKYYKDYPMLGYIEIKTINVKYPILEKATSKALESAVAVSYPSTDVKLNEPGNVVIVGHNYRNGLFFSNNKKLALNDKIYITDDTGRKMVYNIYNIFSTTPEDASFYNRDTQGVPEITLSTCSDDGKTRLIIEAKAEI